MYALSMLGPESRPGISRCCTLSWRKEIWSQTGFVIIGVLQGNLFCRLRRPIPPASYKGALIHAYGNTVLGGYGFAEPREAHRRVLDQRELTAEILSL
jgi:hypothetical protein